MDNIFIMIFFTTLVLASCTESTIREYNYIDFKSNINNFKSIKLSEIAVDLEYVALETKPCLLLEEIKYLDISDNKIALADKNICLLFNRTGKLISKIGKNGKGPGEYTHISQIRMVNDVILIPDASTAYVKFYNEAGNYLYSIKAPGDFSPAIHSRSFIEYTDSTFFVRIPNRTGKEPYRIAHFDKKGQIIHKYRNTSFFNRQKQTTGTSDVSAQFYKLYDKVYYKEMLNDTIWQIENKNLRIAHVIDMGEYGFSIKDKQLPTPVWHKKFTESIDVSFVFESNRHVYILFNFMSHYPFDFKKESNTPTGSSPFEIMGLYNKKEDDFFLVKPSYKEGQPEPTGIENDMDGGINLMPRYNINDTMMVSWINAYELKMYVASETFKTSSPLFPEKKKELEQLANSLNENDNPVLMIVKMKD